MEHPIGTLPPYTLSRFAGLHPQGSVSLDSRVASLPYESSSLATSRGNEKIRGAFLLSADRSQACPMSAIRYPLSAD